MQLDTEHKYKITQKNNSQDYVEGSSLCYHASNNYNQML